VRVLSILCYQVVTQISVKGFESFEVYFQVPVQFAPNRRQTFEQSNRVFPDFA
jgi:hypothetical protein